MNNYFKITLDKIKTYCKMTTSTKQKRLTIFNQTKGFTMNNFTYYINGEEVTRSKAYRLLLANCIEEDTADIYWLSRYNEQGRENIAELTNGSLEIVLK
jgi:hypothetical protein